MPVVVSRLVDARAAVVGAGDPGSSRLVYAMVIGLVLVGVALVVLAVWIIRQTRPDLEVLAPLERMGDGDWRKRDPSTQRRMLDEVRPDGARPLLSEPPPPPLDVEFESDQPVSSFSDLGPGIASESRDPTPLELEADLLPEPPTGGGEDEGPTIEGSEAESAVDDDSDEDDADSDDALVDAVADETPEENEENEENEESAGGETAHDEQRADDEQRTDDEVSADGGVAAERG